jgi:hypothetical protein
LLRSGNIQMSRGRLAAGVTVADDAICRFIDSRCSTSESGREEMINWPQSEKLKEAALRLSTEILGIRTTDF